MAGERGSIEITEALIVDEPWVSKILHGEKTWELRSTHCHKRGWIGLIRKGSGLVVGVARLLDSHGPLSTGELQAARARHCVPVEALAGSKYRYAWELGGARPLMWPVAYEHPLGAVKWVKLADRVSREVTAQLRSA